MKAMIEKEKMMDMIVMLNELSERANVEANAIVRVSRDAFSEIDEFLKSNSLKAFKRNSQDTLMTMKSLLSQSRDNFYMIRNRAEVSRMKLVSLNKKADNLISSNQDYFEEYESEAIDMSDEEKVESKPEGLVETPVEEKEEEQGSEGENSGSDKAE